MEEQKKEPAKQANLETSVAELEKEAAAATTAPMISQQLQEIAAQLLSISKIINKKF